MLIFDTNRFLEFSKFLRLIHRLARYKYRRNRLRDDEAVNAMVVYLARSPAAPIGGKKPIDRKESQTQTLNATASHHAQTIPPQLTIQKDGVIEHPPIKVPLVKVHNIIANSEPTAGVSLTKEETEKKVVPLVLPKAVLSRSNFIIADPFMAPQKEEEIDSQEDYMERKCYQLYRIYCDQQR